MASEKKVKKLAKHLVRLVGEMDQAVGNSEAMKSQEAFNMALQEELSKKNSKNINI